jgi:hypothetical protein
MKLNTANNGRLTLRAVLTGAVSGLVRLVSAVVLSVTEAVESHALTGIAEELGDATSGRGCQSGRDQ